MGLLMSITKDLVLPSGRIFGKCLKWTGAQIEHQFTIPGKSTKRPVIKAQSHDNNIEPIMANVRDAVIVYMRLTKVPRTQALKDIQDVVQSSGSNHSAADLVLMAMRNLESHP